MNPVRLILYRTFQNNIQTLGEMFVVKGEKVLFKCAALELPYKHNQLRISCVLNGIYKCIKRAATKSIPYEHILLLDVDGRSGICIHIGNWFTDILGCILVGTRHVDIKKNGVYDGELDVASSGKAFNKIMKLLPNEFDLEIKQA
ncbi:MAG: DUF5675 family protein [Candidatus Anammoxibacter sp.]